MARHRNPHTGGARRDPNEVYRRAQEAQRAGQWAQAEKLYRAALKAGGPDPGGLREHARMLSQLGRHLEALKTLDRARQLRPDDLDLLAVRGSLLRAAGRVEEAIDTHRKVLAKRASPDAADPLRLGHALRDHGDLDAAREQFEAALALDPTSLPARHEAATCRFRLGDLRGAAEQLDQCLALRPDVPGILMTASAVARARGRHQDAIAFVERALSIQPDLANAHSNLAQLLRELGRIDEALPHFRRAIELAPDASTPRFQLVGAKTYTDRDADVAWIEKAVKDRRFRDGELADLQFALAKLRRDLGDDEGSFTWLQRANATRRATLDYSADDDAARLQRIRETFDRATLARAATAGGCPDHTPIFVVGMPRSGTTLVEQILACHPEVHGAGELTAVQDLCAHLPELRGSESPFGVPKADAETLHAAGTEYVARLRDHGDRDHGDQQRAPRHVVDKMPMNSLFVGAIRFLLPEARFVQMRRDARDTCLSIYRTNFRGGEPYSYDLAELGRHHREHDALLEHWRAHLPSDRLLEVQYEQLVQDLEGQVRRLCDFLGLEFDPGMLRFHEAGRAVVTASLDQIRRPVYTTSIGGWKRYEQQLAPLLEALG